MADEETVRCRKCRKVLITEIECLINAHGQRHHGGKIDSEEESNECAADSERSCLYIAEDSYPPFIAEALDESSWTKGKLKCFGCQARIGSFSFISGNHCSCGSHIVPQVHLLVSKVDVRRAREVLPQPVSYPDRPVALSAAVTENFPILLSSGSSSNCTSESDVSPLSAASHQLCNAEDTHGVTDHSGLQYQDSLGNNELTASVSSRSQGDSLKDRNRTEMRQRRAYRQIPNTGDDSDLDVPCSTSSNFHVLSPEAALKDSVSEDEDSRTRRCEDIPLHLTCSVCLDLLYSPCVAHPCCHVFCEPCLRRLARPNPTQTLCPLCRQVIGQCMPSKDLSAEVREKFPVLHQERRQFERKHSINHTPLPWLRNFRMEQFTVNRGSLVQMAGGWRPILLMLTGNVLGFGSLAVLRWYLKSQRNEKDGETFEVEEGFGLE